MCRGELAGTCFQASEPFTVFHRRRLPWREFLTRSALAAGACDSPDGKWLFFNIQSPGITFAVTGPWGSGGL
jgi:secreted PhoX family phosphatase